MADATEISFKKFRSRYNTEAACRAEIFRLRFPNGITSPKRGCLKSIPSVTETPISAVPVSSDLRHR